MSILAKLPSSCELPEYDPSTKPKTLTTTHNKVNPMTEEHQLKQVHPSTELNGKYASALDRIYDLYVYGRSHRTMLQEKLDMAKDELLRIQLICQKNAPNEDDQPSETLEARELAIGEIFQLCNKGLENIHEEQ